MNFDRHLPVKLKEFFQLNPVSEYLEPLNILILRRDGVILYSNSEKIDKSTAGALMGGVWQAANALTSVIPQNRTDDIYRLSFDTSSQGLYMLPFQVCQKEYYLSILYCNQINPAQMKCRIRDLGNKLSEDLTRIFSTSEKEAKKNKRKKTANDEGLLFKDISDAEIDSLFSFERNGLCPS